MRLGQKQDNMKQGRDAAYAGAVMALDTSTAAMAAAVVEDGRVLGEVQTMAERNHSVHVMTLVQSLMEQCGVSPDRLRAVAAGVGPGSYTGVRIAVTAAKTLAWAWDKQLAGVSSLEALAYGALHEGAGLKLGEPHALQGVHWLLPIMDARRGQVYTAGFELGESGVWSRWADDGIRLMSDWVDAMERRLASYCGSSAPTVWLAGDGSMHEAEAERLMRIGADAGANVRLLPHIMQGRYVAALAVRNLESSAAADMHGFVPNYTQVTEAEAKLNARQAGDSES